MTVPKVGRLVEHAQTLRVLKAYRAYQRATEESLDYWSLDALTRKE